VIGTKRLGNLGGTRGQSQTVVYLVFSHGSALVLFGGPQDSSRDDAMIAVAVQWAERRVRTIDGVLLG
jgi:hypothetical protein